MSGDGGRLGEGARASGRPRWRLLALAAGVYAVHVALVLYALPPGVLLSPEPFGTPDYQTHYQQTVTVGRLLDREGRLYGYDTKLLAGVPVGLFFDVDNKGHFAFSRLLHAAGVPLPIAFKLFAFVSMLLAPLCLFGAARLLYGPGRAALVALVFGVLIWHFDTTTRFLWVGGMISFATTSHLAILAAALYYRFIRERGIGHFAALLLLLPVVHLIHVWAFGILCVPLVVTYLRRARHLSAAKHAAVWSLVLATLAANAYWLIPALRHLDVMAASGHVGQATPGYFVADWLEVLVNPINTGFGQPRTLFRFAALLGAVATLVGWRRRRDPRFGYGALLLGTLLALTYGAALVPGLREMEPYRFAVPAAMAAGVLGAPAWAWLLRRERWRALPGWARVAAACGLVLLIPRAGRQITYFMPEVLPRRAPAGLAGGGHAPGGRGWRLGGLAPEMKALARFVREGCREPGRLLVQDWPVGEFLRWATDRPIIGGFPERRHIHQDANLFRSFTDPRQHGRALADYLVRYHVRYVIFSGAGVPWVEKRRDLLEPLKLIAPYRIYRVRHRGTDVAEGSGRVAATLNRISVRDARPGPDGRSLVLRYHYFSPLRCRPGCRVVREPLPHDRAGFIRVRGEPALPARFTVEMTYP